MYNIGPDDNEISIKQLAYKVGHHCEIYPSLEHFPDRPQEVKMLIVLQIKLEENLIIMRLSKWIKLLKRW